MSTFRSAQNDANKTNLLKNERLACEQAAALKIPQRGCRISPAPAARLRPHAQEPVELVAGGEEPKAEQQVQGKRQTESQHEAASWTDKRRLGSPSHAALPGLRERLVKKMSATHSCTRSQIQN